MSTEDDRWKEWIDLLTEDERAKMEKVVEKKLEDADQLQQPIPLYPKLRDHDIFAPAELEFPPISLTAPGQ